jgi:hypothetical protein
LCPCCLDYSGQHVVTVVEGGLTFRAVIGIGPSRYCIFGYPCDGHALKIDQLNLTVSEADETNPWSVVFLGNLYQLDGDTGV